jgi:hypothetical protein
VNALCKRLSRCYALMTFIYPYEFRQQFSREMRSVFEEKLLARAGSSKWQLWHIFWLELRDWPAAVLREYWDAINKILGRGIMSLITEDKHWSITDRREAFLAALPPLIFGCGIALSAAVIREPWYAIPRWQLYAGLLITLLPAAVVVLGGGWALIRRLPEWGYPWVGAAGMGILLFVKTLAEERADEGLPMVSPVIDILIAGFLLACLSVLLGLAAWRGWRHAGMVSLGFATVIGLFTLQAVTAAPFNRHDLALLAAPAGVLMSLLSYLYVHQGDALRIAAIVGYGFLNTTMLLIARSVWQPWLIARGMPSPVLPLFVVLMVAVLVGPVAGMVGRPLRRVIHGS